MGIILFIVHVFFSAFYLTGAISLVEMNDIKFTIIFGVFMLLEVMTAIYLSNTF